MQQTHRHSHPTLTRQVLFLLCLSVLAYTDGCRQRDGNEPNREHGPTHEGSLSSDSGPSSDASVAFDASLGPHSKDAEGPKASDDAGKIRDAGERQSDARDGEAEPAPELPRDAGTATDTDAAPCINSLQPTERPPPVLSATGLYENITAKQVSAALLEFTPKYVLWSDGADKQRWIYLPECERIDSTAMDEWDFAVGTRAFKEFSMDGKRLETRMVHRFGPGPDDFLFAHYLWNTDESEASLITEDTAPSKLVSPKGAQYVIPTPDMCTRCHGERGGPEGGLPSRYLGFSAIQLSHSGPGATMRSLSDAGRLTRSRASGYHLEANAVQEAALGYLHANCGHCHNETEDGVHFPANPMSLLLSTRDETAYDTGAYDSLIDVETLGYQGDCTHRVYPGDPGVSDPPSGALLSCVLERMMLRDGGSRQMPPLATHQVDESGVDTIRSWIASFRPTNDSSHDIP